MSLESSVDLLRSDVSQLLAEAPLSQPSLALKQEARRVARHMARVVTPTALPEGTPVGPYTIRRSLGSGGQATVYLAEDESGKAYALKIPRQQLLTRLIREAQILFHLDHPRIVRIERAVVDAEIPYIACEYVPGGTLAERLQDSPLSQREALNLARDILNALVYGHAKGVVHRDLKPSNLLFDEDGRVKVADFGIGSLRLVEDLGLAETLVSLDHTLRAGTPIYMAPEQENPELRVDGKVDGRADLYALGKVLFQALTGRSPRTVRPVSLLVPGIPEAWDTFLFRLLEDRPQDRYASAEEAREALYGMWEATQSATLEDSPDAMFEHAIEVLARSENAERSWAAWPPMGLSLRQLLSQPSRYPAVFRLVLITATCSVALGALAGALIAVVKIPSPFGVGLLGAAALGAMILAVRWGVGLAQRPPRASRFSGGLSPLARAEVVVDAVTRLAQGRYAALIALERRDSLGNYAATGTHMRGVNLSSAQLQGLFSVTFPGRRSIDPARGTIIRGATILATQCFFPLPARQDLDSDLETQHEAGVGLTEIEDALVVVVSGTTGEISLAEGGRLERWLDGERLRNLLVQRLY